MISGEGGSGADTGIPRHGRMPFSAEQTNAEGSRLTLYFTAAGSILPCLLLLLLYFNSHRERCEEEADCLRRISWLGKR